MRRLLRKIILITMINMNSRDFHKVVGKDIYCTGNKVLGGDAKNSSQRRISFWDHGHAA